MSVSFQGGQLAFLLRLALFRKFLLAQLSGLLLLVHGHDRFPIFQFGLQRFLRAVHGLDGLF